MALKKICAITKKPFFISDQEIAFCESNQIPLPTIAPHERLREMLSFYNSIFLYNSTCDLTGKPMLSIVPPSKKVKTYDIGVWMDDTAWDPLSYGRDFDFSRSFFEQFNELQREVPIPSRSVVLSTMENSDYTNGISGAKNCYLIFDSDNSEDCYFCYHMNTVKNIVDSINIKNSELCYASKHLTNCYNLKFAENCANCSDSTFLFNCHNLKNCFGCTNLSNKEYYWYNEPLPPEEFKIQYAKLRLGSYSELEKEKKKFADFKAKSFVKELTGLKNENSTGNFLNETKDCTNTFFSSNAENCENCIRANKGKNSFVYAIFGNHIELLYNSAVCGHNVYNAKFCLNCFVNPRDIEYCIYVGFGSENCFGCIGLRKKQYCILNKQYSKEKYFELVQRIKQHMLATGEYGKWFPNSFSAYYYNKSEAMNFFPLTREQALERGFSWEEETMESFEPTYQIPDDINDVKDDILSAILRCNVTGKKYRIIKQELALYRRFQLPIPRVSPLERLRNHCQALNIPEVSENHCAKCQKKISTVYGGNNVYCEECYANAA